MLIFDFDGTIADSLPLLLECVNNNATYYGYKEIHDPEQLRSRDTREILRESGISYLKLPFILSAIRKEMSTKIALLKPFPDMAKVLTELHHKKIPLGILTSNAQDTVAQFLQEHALNFFDLIYGESSIFGKGKVIKHLLTTYDLDPSLIIYIGDETRDIEAAQVNNIRCAAVTWGFNTAQKLQEKNPDFLINKPEELLKLAHV